MNEQVNSQINCHGLLQSFSVSLFLASGPCQPRAWFAFHTWKMVRIAAFFDISLDDVTLSERTLPLGFLNPFNVSSTEGRDHLEKETECQGQKIVFIQDGKKAESLIFPLEKEPLTLGPSSGGRSKVSVLISLHCFCTACVI